MSSPTNPIERLFWDSEFFGFGIGRVASARLTHEDASACMARARETGLRCLYFLADAGDPDSWRAAIGAGFDPIDVRIELDRTLPDVASTSLDFTIAVADDVPSLLEVARGAFRQSRFFRDGRFPAGKAEELFAVWVRRGVSADDGFTVLGSGAATRGAFVSARAAAGEGRIELFAVAPELRGRGIGPRLLDAGMSELVRRGARRVSVVTQGSNGAALRTYERAGFRTRSVGLWFHGWP